MSADSEVMQLLVSKAEAALVASTTTAGGGRHGVTDLALVTPGRGRAADNITLGLSKTHFREPLCFRCNYFGHMKRDCPFHFIL